jgi:hypothetical protein
VLTPVVWLFVDDLSTPMVWINKWTLAVGICFLLHLVLTVLHTLTGRRRQNADKDETAS